MNRSQVITFLIASIAIGLVFLFPPYSIDGGLIGGTVYVFFRNPPSPSDVPTFNSRLIGLELACILFSASAALLALGPRGYRRRRVVLAVGLILELVMLGCSAPFPEFAWYVLTFFAFLLFAVILSVQFMHC